VKGFGWATVDALSEPISASAGVLWLLAAALVLGAAVTLAVGPPRWWWAFAVSAAVLSQVMVVTAWSDAKAGTAAYVVLLVAALVAFASRARRMQDATVAP
jgi:hypothetical protein